MRESWTQTYAGGKFDILNPNPEDVVFEDIAAGLAGICRFKGSTLQHYSVAEHSLHVLNIVEKVSFDPLVHWFALMHDAAEAYLGDFPAPWKQQVAIGGKHISEIEMEIDKAICKKLLDNGSYYPLSPEISQLIARADLAMVYQEKEQALSKAKQSWGKRFDEFTLFEHERTCIEWLNRGEAKRRFTEAYCRIQMKLHQ